MKLTCVCKMCLQNREVYSNAFLHTRENLYFSFWFHIFNWLVKKLQKTGFLSQLKVL
jgi:hypothetical protein